MSARDATRRSIFQSRGARRVSLALGSLAVLGLCVWLRSLWPTQHASAEAPPAARSAPRAESGEQPAGAPAAAAEAPPETVAIVNNERITRNQLAQECMRHFGEEILESLVNKHLIAAHCEQRKITVSEAEVQAEIDRQADRFGLPTDQWLRMLEDERGISPTQYARDIIWPTVALRKLAASQLKVTASEIQEAYETQFGEARQCRLIACDDRQAAVRVHSLARRNPDDFPNLARQYSVDTNSASASGLILPIRRHLGDPQIEAIAFSLQPGEVSEVLQVGNQFVILKLDTVLPARETPLEDVRDRLAEAIRDKKLREAADGLFEQLQRTAEVHVIYTDPKERAAHPGVAATINGRKITVRELAEECVERHGLEVLEGMISRLLLEQALKQHKLQVQSADIEAEIARAAEAMGKLKPDGSPDVDGWMQEVTEGQGIARELYIHDTVWPTAALKLLVGDGVEVTDEDIQRGYEANYGPRVRCRAIVCSQMRAAQEVWDLARKDSSVEHFAELAEQYSVEPGSRALGGEVPPIQRHGGQPTLEQEAYRLKAGELSGIIQVDDKFVILLCEGYTKPTVVDLAEVRDLIVTDIHEKKLRIAMAQTFAQLEEHATIDNLLAGTSYSPADHSPAPAAPAPRTAERASPAPGQPARQ